MSLLPNEMIKKDLDYLQEKFLKVDFDNKLDVLEFKKELDKTFNVIVAYYFELADYFYNEFLMRFNKKVKKS